MVVSPDATTTAGWPGPPPGDGARRTHPLRWRAVTYGAVHDRGRFAVRHPVWFSLAVATLSIGPLGAALPATNAVLLAAGADPRSAELWAGLSMQVVRTVFVVALLVRYGWWVRAGLTGVRDWRALHLLWLPAVYTVLNALGTKAWPGAEAATVGTVTELFTGVFEEALVRGLMLYAMLVAWHDRRTGVRDAVLVSSVIFGGLHAFNLLVGAPLVPTLAQIGYATLLGLGFAGVALRTNTIWPLALLHGLIDVSANVFTPPDTVDTPAPGIGDLAGPILIMLPLGLYGLFLVRARRTRPAS